MVCLGPAVCVLLMTAVVCVGAGAVGCVCIGACGGAVAESKCLLVGYTLDC